MSRFFYGIGAGMVAAVIIVFGLQYAIWGSSAPDWYAGVSVLIGMICGSVGVMVASR